MPSISLYNKYRSRTFADPADHPLVGQDHVTRTLRNAVATSQIAHAYLFCGPRGTGKTSAARILARAVNCKRGLSGEPCNQCENCQALISGRQLDLLVEIDGASNRGVDDVRALRERILQRPGGADLTGRFKVYIIDEVHMLTTEAFNALLKSLEEPPDYVIFVLATTDPQKVPATVASRCQRFDFKPIPLETLARHLESVAEAERVAIEPAALELLARAAAGGARDAVSLLDQAFSYAGVADVPPAAGGLRGTVTVAHVQAMLGVTDFDAVCALVDALIGRDLPAALRQVQEVVAKGADLRQFTRQVLEFLRALLLTQSQAADLLHLSDETQLAIGQRAARLGLGDLVRLIKLFGQAEQGLKSPAAQPQLPLELAVVEALVAPVVGATAPAPQIVPPAPPPVQHRSETVSPPDTSSPSPSGPPAVAPNPFAAPEGAASVHPTPAAAARPLDGLPPDERPASPARGGEAPRPPMAPEMDARAVAQAEGTGSAVAPVAADAAPTGGAPTVVLGQVQSRWPALLADLRRSNHRPLEALLKEARPIDVEPGNVVLLSFKYPFHSGKVQEVANLIAVEKALSRVLGVASKVRCVVDGAGDGRAERPRSQPVQHDPVVAKALRIWRARILDDGERAAVEALPTVPVSAVLEGKEHEP